MGKLKHPLACDQEQPNATCPDALGPLDVLLPSLAGDPQSSLWPLGQSLGTQQGAQGMLGAAVPFKGTVQGVRGSRGWGGQGSRLPQGPLLVHLKGLEAGFEGPGGHSGKCGSIHSGLEEAVAALGEGCPKPASPPSCHVM